jgi:DNA-binding transcriptional LysR family regulator
MTKARGLENLRLPSIEDMQLVIAAAEGGSLSQAARSMGTTQPTASWRLERIESGLGTELFVRSKRGVHPTRTGRLLIARARQMLSQWEGLDAELRAESQDVRGRYSIGVYPPSRPILCRPSCPDS